jgi:hypothetical protein
MKIANGLAASSAYDLRRVRRSSQVPFHGMGATPQGDITDAYGDGFLPLTSFESALPLTTSLDTRALQRLYKKLQEEVQVFQALPFVKELPQSKKLLFERGTQLLSSASATRGKLNRLYYMYRKQRGGYSRFISDGSNLWLEFRFCDLPLISDINSVWDELNNGMLGYTPTVRGSATDTKHTSRPTAPTGVGACNWNRHTTISQVARIKYTAGLKLQVDGVSKFGLSPSSWMTDFWEVTPWSWLVDYLIDVQTFLAQFQVASLPYIYITRSNLQKNNYSVYVTSRPPNTRYVHGACLYEEVVYSRVPLGELPFYVPELTLARPFEGVRLWNISAIAGQRYRPFT